MLLVRLFLVSIQLGATNKPTLSPGCCGSLGDGKDGLLDE